MPFKDEFGIWRHDKSTEERGEIECLRCGDEMETELFYDVDDYDENLERDYPELFTPDGYNPLCYYQRCHAECHTCGRVLVYGPRWYWNSTTNKYDLPRPLSFQKAKQAEIDTQREAARAAGQLELFAAASNEAERTQRPDGEG